MKIVFSIGLFLLNGWSAATAAIYTSASYSGPAYTVPDGNPNGVWSSIIVNGARPAVLDVTINLNITGGYNGDLYAYLSYNGQLVPLLNRVGVNSDNRFGADGSGMDVLLSDSAPVNIHAAVNGFLNGNYRIDGQNLSPLSPAANFNANGGSITLNQTFGGINPNGTWTLFVADLVSSSGSSTVNGWTLNITAVPEPGIASLVVLGAIAFAGRQKVPRK